ncbi:hypothetical protein [Microbispora sp. NPDC046933]|uniref:hypothetical protein n=1 Tax=Microbispora sp. NPDC046933 TaxID=3155618 RepID=UPI0033D2B464
METSSVDDALDVLDLLITSNLLARAERAGKAEQLRTFPKLRKAARTMASAVEVLMSAPEATEDRLVSLVEVWKAIEEVVPREKLASAVETIVAFVHMTHDDAAAEWRAELIKRYRTVQGFIELPLEVFDRTGLPADFTHIWTRSARTGETCWGGRLADDGYGARLRPDPAFAVGPVDLDGIDALALQQAGEPRLRRRRCLRPQPASGARSDAASALCLFQLGGTQAVGERPGGLLVEERQGRFHRSLGSVADVCGAWRALHGTLASEGSAARGEARGAHRAPGRSRRGSRSTTRS